jgi:hypothetical protein
MLGFVYILLLGLTEKLAFFSLIFKNSKQDQSLFTSLNYLIIAISFFFYDFFRMGYNFELLFDSIYNLFSTKIFLILLFLENISLYYALRNFNKQNSFVHIAFASFSTIYIMPLLVFFYSTYFGLETKISSPYDSFLETLFFSCMFFILSFLYFFQKIKDNNKLKNKIDLIIYAILLVNCLYFSLLNIQLANYQYLLYSFVFFFLAIQQFFFLFKYKKEGCLIDSNLLKEEEKEAQKTCFSILNIDVKKIKSFFIFHILYVITFLLSIFAAKLIAIEIYATLKRISTIIGGGVVDYLKYYLSLKQGDLKEENVKKFLPTKYDYFILFLIVFVAFVSYIY